MKAKPTRSRKLHPRSFDFDQVKISHSHPWCSNKRMKLRPYLTEGHRQITPLLVCHCPVAIRKQIKLIRFCSKLEGHLRISGVPSIPSESPCWWFLLLTATYSRHVESSWCRQVILQTKVGSNLFYMDSVMYSSMHVVYY